MKKLRLVRVTVLPEFVIDDGESLSPLSAHVRNEDGSPLVLSTAVLPADWPNYATTDFVKAMKDMEKRLNPIEGEEF